MVNALLQKFYSAYNNTTVRNILNTLIFIGIVVGFTIFLQNNTYRQDEFAWSFIYTDSIMEFIKTTDQGKYLPSWMLNLIVHGTAVLQNIHPNDNIIPKIFIGLSFATIIFLISAFSTYIYDKRLSPLMIIFSGAMVQLLVAPARQVIIFYTQHFTYIFGLIPFLLALLVFSKVYIQQKTQISKWILCVTAFFVSSIHINIFISIGTLLSILFISALINGVLYKWDFKTIGSIYQKAFKQFWAPLSFYLLGIILFFMSPHLHYVAKARTGASFETILSWLPEYIKPFIGSIFYLNNVWVVWFIFLIVFIVLIFLITKPKISIENQKTHIVLNNGSLLFWRMIIICVSVIAALLVFNFSLISQGNDMYGSGLFWVLHSNVRATCNLMFLAILLMGIGYINTILPEKRFSIFVTIFACCICLTTVLQYKYLFSYMTFSKQNWYQTEKIYRFYALQGKTAILPANLEKDNGDFWHEYLFNSSDERPYDWTGSSYILRNYPIIYYKDTTYSKKSYPAANLDVSFSKHFDDKPPYYVEYIMTNSNTALSLYQQAGGIITEEELKNPNFSKLFDEGFVLSNQ